MFKSWQNTKPLTKGIITILISALGFALMALFMRFAQGVPLAEKAIFRNLITAFVSGYVVYKTKVPFCGKKQNRLILIIRSICGLLGILFGIYIIDHLVLSDVDMMGKLTTFFLIILSAIILKERPSVKQWLLCALAFAGCLLIIKPSFSSSFYPYFIGVLSAVFTAGAYLCLRILGDAKHSESPNTIVFFFSSFSVLVLLPFVIFNFQPLSLENLFYLIMSGLSATLAQFSVTLAFKYASAKEISIYSYASVIFAGLFDYLIFNRLADNLSLIGYVIIFISGFLMHLVNKNQK